jgi:hypothetical protein
MGNNALAWVARLGTIALAAASTGCVVVDELERYDPQNNPGNKSWSTSEKVDCTSDKDCATGESCQNNVCQMRRCAEAYESKPPLGINRYFGTDGELAIISDNTFIDGFESDGTGKYLNSWEMPASGNKIVDITGGNLTGKRPHQIAVALEFTDKVKIKDGNGTFDLQLPMWPKAIAAGDTDADGLDELVAVSQDGAVAVCRVDKKSCSSSKFSGIKVVDVAVADVDADGFAEPVFLTDDGKNSGMVVWNLDAKKTGQKETLAWTVNLKIRAMAAGQVRANGPAEMALLEDRGWWGFANDRVHLFSPATEKITSSVDVNGHTIDVAVGDRNSDDVAEIAFLRDDHKYELMSAKDGMLTKIGEYAITVGKVAQRISMVDWNGDSASGRLSEGPVLVPGNAIPIAALVFPPFPSHVAANGASVSLGSTESTSTSNSKTVSLSVGLAVSFEAELPLFKAGVGAHINKDFSKTHTITKTQSVGQSFEIDANPSLFGTDYGAVVMSCGCYHRYRYVTEDPANRIGGSGKGVDIYVPVGGQTQLWSTKRYNAMAKAVKTLPVIDIPARIGDVKSYPRKIQTLSGEPVPTADMLFPKPPTFQVSDVGTIGFSLSAGKSETNETAETTTLGVSGSLEAFGVGVEATIDVGVTQGYSIEVGNETEFGGTIPAIHDDPNTPEDEFAINHYGFTPFVYRQHYKGKNGKDAAFYVLYHAMK